MRTHELTHLQSLEAEAIHVMREVAAEFERPVLLFPGGKDSMAATLQEVIAEITRTPLTERGETRADDRVSEAAMEDRKRAGYF